MKVTYIRVKMKPHAACQHLGCGWQAHASYFGLTPARVRTEAQRHVRDTGHHVEVEIRDITRYEPASS